MATRSSYPVPVVGYRLVNNIWGESKNERDFTCKESHLATPIVQSSRNLRPLSVYEAWGPVPRRHFKSLFYGPKRYSLPKDPPKTDPLGQLQRDSESSSYSRAYHLQNFHDKGYETKVVPTNNEPLGSLGNEHYHRKQHFIKGVVPGGSMENKMIYGTDELLRQSQERQKLKNKENSLGFMYGTEAATNVGRPKPSRKPNNALLLEAKTYEDQAYKNKKLARDQVEYLEMDRREKRKQWEERQNEKRRDLEMLRSYEPWGRQGGGAPLSKDIDKLETRRTKSIRAMQEEEAALFGSTQRGGGGAPMRTESGKPMTSLRGDRELRFPLYSQNADIDPTLRYKKDSGYRRELDKTLDDVKTRRQNEHQRNFEEELLHINHYPFGKPGGGAPMRDQKGHLKSSFPITLSKDIEELRNVEPRHPHAYNNIKEKESDLLFREKSFDPWGKGYGTALRDKDGRVIRPIQPNHGNMDGLGMELGKPGAGAPIKDQDGNIRTRKAQTLTRTTNGGNFSRDFSPKGSRDLYNPFGKPGAGAPVRDSEGRVKTNIMGKVEHEIREYSPNTTRNELLAKQTYLKTLQEMQEQAHMQRRAEDAELKTSSKDVASWLRTGVVGQPKFDPVTKEIVAAHKQTSDVTQQKLNIRKQKNELSQTYHSELEVLARERHQQKEREKQFDKITSTEHVSTMNRTWGRPGGGAPLTHGDVINARKQKVGLVPADEIGFRLM